MVRMWRPVAFIMGVTRRRSASDVAGGQEFPIAGVVGQEAGGLLHPLNLAPVFGQHQPGHQFHPLAVPLQDLPGGQVLDHQEQAHQGHQQGEQGDP